MSYDLFISYSRRDDKKGQVSTLKEQIEADYRSFAKEELRCFFDLKDIASMDDWRHRILEGLRDSNLLLLVLSPAYLDSPYCEWEIVEFLKYEHSRSVGGQGVTPVYFVEIPGLDEPGFEERAATWLARVRRRNQVDLRPWYHEGVEALKQADVRQRLDDLERSLHTRLSRLRRLREASGNLPAHNPRFVGREAEMQRLHEAAGLGRFGVLTAVQGMGGVGKTALAIQYAYAYADFYPGGRWLVGCAGETSLAAAVRRLDLGITLNDAEKRDDTLAARRVLAELERRTIEGAKARSGENDPPQPKALLLLDNVDHPELLQPPQSDLLTGRQWLHVLATTRSGAEEFGNDPECLTVLSIDELPEDDALRLIESYQPGGCFPTPQERDAALEIVKLLGGFTLAVEVVGVHLGERAGRVTCAAFLERMKKEGLGKFDDIIRGTKGGIRHGEKLIGATLKPTLDLLSEQERLVLSYAALLPPDSIPLPWLRTLAAKDFPDLGHDAEPGYDDPWLSLVNHFLGLRLLQTVDLAEDGRTPRLLRMHRLVGELVCSTTPNADTLSNRLSNHLKARCNELEETWHLHQWEIAPLISYTNGLWVGHAAIFPKFVRSLCQWLPNFDYGRYSKPTLKAALAQLEETPSSDPSDLSTTLSNLGWALQMTGLYAEAEKHLRRALEIDEGSSQVDEAAILIRCNQLEGCLMGQGRLAEAEPFCRRAFELAEKTLGPDHRLTLNCMGRLASLLAKKGEIADAESLARRVLEVNERICGPEHFRTLNNLSTLGHVLFLKNDYAGAEALCLRDLECRERIFGPEHPDTLRSKHNLAELLRVKGDYVNAEPLFHQALAGYDKVLGPDHPHSLGSMNNLARLLYDKGDYAAAEPLYRRVLESHERVLGPEHPDTLISINRLAGLLYSKGDYTATEPLDRRLLEASERVLGPEHPDTLISVSNLAKLLLSKGDYAAAEPFYRRALEARERLLGPEHPDFISSLNQHAYGLRKAGFVAEAEPYDRRSAEIMSVAPGNWAIMAPKWPHS
jgi:tetratricopeptide (TPR) repeat protein